MMVSVEVCRDMLENESVEVLNKKKEDLIKFIDDYENNRLSSLAFMIEPSPQVKYEMYKEYLKEVEKLINEKR